MKYAVIVTYTTGERTGATVTASGCAAAWDKVFEMFDKADVRGVELAAILTPERRSDECRFFRRRDQQHRMIIGMYLHKIPID